MSSVADRLTGIELPGTLDPGVADYGRKTASQMIALYRRKAQRELAVATAILAANDEDFRVTTYRGVYVQRDLQVVQEGRTFEAGGDPR